MRKFALALAVLALALPAAAAARFGDKGDGTIVVKGARGQLSVNATGSALGRVDDGTIVVTDTSLGATDDIQVLGYDAPPKTDKSGTTTTYTGTRMRYRIVGGSYLLVATGKGINVTAVGRGAVWGNDLRDGQYSADGSLFKTLIGGVLPFAVTFGAQ